MSDKHTPRNERKPKPVKLPAAPWERAQGGKSSVLGITMPDNTEGPSADRKVGAA